MPSIRDECVTKVLTKEATTFNTYMLFTFLGSFDSWQRIKGKGEIQQISISRGSVEVVLILYFSWFPLHRFLKKLLQEARQKSREECKKNPYVELRSKVLNFCHRTFEKYLGNESTSCLPSKQVKNLFLLSRLQSQPHKFILGFLRSQVFWRC